MRSNLSLENTQRRPKKILIGSKHGSRKSNQTAHTLYFHVQAHGQTLLINLRTQRPRTQSGASCCSVRKLSQFYQVALVVKNPPANARDVGLIPELGRSLGEGNSNPLQCSGWENLMDRETWLATVHGVAKSQTRLSN